MLTNLQSLHDHRFTTVNQFPHGTPALHAPMRAHAVYGVAFFAGLLAIAWWRTRRALDVTAGLLLVRGVSDVGRTPLLTATRRAATPRIAAR